MSIQYVGELLALLDHIDPDTPVRLALQPAHPIECDLGGLDLIDDVVYLTAGEQADYLRGDVREELWGS